MSTMRTHRKAIAGFSMVEMLVVIAIIAFLMAWALPNYKNLITQYRLADELTQIQTDVELARSSAVRTGSNVTICPTAAPASSVPACSGGNEWNTGWVVFTDVNDDQTLDPGDKLLHVHIGMTGGDTLLSEIDNAGTAVNTVTFNQMGGTAAWGGSAAAPNNGQLVLTDANNDPGAIRCLTISDAGMITVTSPQTQSQTPTPPTCTTPTP
jgi:type IV fimbrial biogenesis protein FimT